jgi:HSP20 family protein
MLTRWNTGWSDDDDMFSTVNQLRQYMDEVLANDTGEQGWTGRRGAQLGASWPRANLVDAGSTLMLSAEVPGLSEKEIKLSLDQDVLTLTGERATHPPDGYAVHRQERASIQFSRSFALPCRVDADRTSAVVRNGILTVTLAKASDAMPREISVNAR